MKYLVLLMSLLFCVGVNARRTFTVYIHSETDGHSSLEVRERVAADETLGTIARIFLSFFIPPAELQNTLQEVLQDLCKETGNEVELVRTSDPLCQKEPCSRKGGILFDDESHEYLTAKDIEGLLESMRTSLGIGAKE